MVALALFQFSTLRPTIEFRVTGPINLTSILPIEGQLTLITLCKFKEKN